MKDLPKNPEFKPGKTEMDDLIAYSARFYVRLALGLGALTAAGFLLAFGLETWLA